MTWQRLMLFGAIVLLFSSCYKDLDNTTTETTEDRPETVINTRIGGNAENPDGTLLTNYSLSWSNGTTSVSGKQFITDLTAVSKYDETIWVIKNDEVLGLSHLPLVENDINETSVLLFPAWTSETITDQKTLSIQEVFVTIDPLEFAAASVDVRYRSLANIDQQISHGYSRGGELMRLTDVSLHHIDLEDVVADGQLSVQPPAGYSVFGYNQTRGIWSESPLRNEAVSITPGFFVIAKVAPAIFGSGVIERENQSIAYQRYQIEQFSGRSTAKGNWLAVLPQNTDVDVELLNPCNELINIESISTDQVDIVANLEVGNAAILQALQAQVVDCDFNPTSSNIIQVTEAGAGDVLYYFSDPEISTVISLCGETFEITAYQPNENEEVLTIPWTTEIGDEMQFLSTCPLFKDGYSYYKINGDVKVYEPFDVNQMADRTELVSADGNMKFIFRGDMKGHYEASMVNLKIYDEFFGNAGYAVSCETTNQGCGIENVYVSHLNEQDGSIRVTFSGNIWMQTLNPLTAGNFPVEGVIICKVD